MGRALWIPDKCRAAGLNVVECDGWRERGSSTFTPRLVVAHHTGDGATGEMPSLGLLIRGRSGLPGPLCQVGLGRSGTVYVVASGRANHAGSGGYRGVSGNSNAFGIEAENNGSQPWPARQLIAYFRLAAVLLLAIGKDHTWVCGHKEWTSRKWDPGGIDMNVFRAEVAREIKDLTQPQIQPQGEDEMYLFIAPDNTGGVFFPGRPAGERIKLFTNNILYSPVFEKAGVKHLGKLTTEQYAELKGL